MDKDEVLAAIEGTFGTDLLEFVDDAYGVRKGSRYYVDVTVPEGAEEEVEQTIVSLCGRGVDASSRKRPVLNNRLSNSFDSAELLTVYDHMQSGTNGAKTVPTTIYTAVVNGRHHVFIFGA